jgi:hypothetical protein
MADKVINMVKYGFVRNKEGDFSDDGTRFQSYYFDPQHKGDKRVEVSKAVTRDGVFISASYYNTKTGRSIYFDDLNGVTYDYAIENLPKLAQDIKQFLDKLDAEGDYMVTLTAEQYNDIVDHLVSDALNRKRQTYDYQEYLRYIQDEYGIDYRDIGIEQRRQLEAGINQKIRNSTAVNPVVLKHLAKALLNRTMELMRGKPGSYGYGNKWNPGTDPKPLEQALEEAARYVSISSYRSNKEAADLLNSGVPQDTIIYLKDQNDRAQEKIIAWAKDKLEKLYDFEWSED